MNDTCWSIPEKVRALGVFRSLKLSMAQ
ncbi:hypothetical protein Atc_2395 [Acidithiobacillus caldus SM-1]|uniref:Uncharacterized protein n=1 Tax=Acidithiobacillus caldus (strain SM-1) TaxID=990288 RepID=F9ZRK4_ACICS|nr:hypothetical protein Atc_2395 [Acidithiobacillus caldus SM-1]